MSRSEVISIPQVVAIDYDHTMGEPDIAMQKLDWVLKQVGVAISPTLLEEKRVKARYLGMPFSPLDVVRDIAGPDVCKQAQESFRSAEWKDQMGRVRTSLYDDVERFNDRLAVAGIHQFGFTYGNDWQADKFVADGLQMSILLMPTPEKSQYLRAFQQQKTNSHEGMAWFESSDGIFQTNSLCVIDNSVETFGPEFPENFSGFCIRRGGRFPADSPDLERLPESVQVITSLDELAVRDGRVVRIDPDLNMDNVTPIRSRRTDESRLIFPVLPVDAWPKDLPVPQIITPIISTQGVPDVEERNVYARS